jgi:hypothetical protein
MAQIKAELVAHFYRNPQRTKLKQTREQSGAEKVET